jgi:hypothetical protein
MEIVAKRLLRQEKGCEAIFSPFRFKLRYASKKIRPGTLVADFHLNASSAAERDHDLRQKGFFELFFWNFSLF